jgi:drug/metabolite transporter (DMT)-like permease
MANAPLVWAMDKPTPLARFTTAGSERLGPARFGMALGVAAYGLFSVHDASIKYVVATVPVWQVLFFRSLTITVACLAVGRIGLVERIRATPLKAALLWRAVLTLTAWICYYTASRHLPLAQMTTLYFTAPVMVTVMAAPFLRERVTPVRWVSVALGFLGVVLAGHQHSFEFSRPVILVLVAASFWAFGVIQMRQIARRESSLLQMLVTNGFFSVATGVACLATWVPLRLDQVALIAVIVVFGGLAQFILFESARLAPAAVMATVEYTALIWAFLFGFLIWGDVPTVPVIAGAGLILVAGWLAAMGSR